MKTQSLLLVASLQLTFAPLTNALDLTPHPGFRMLENVKIPVLIFEDAPRKIQWQAPTNWTISGGGDLLRLRPLESSKSGMELRAIPRNSAKAPDPATERDATLSWVQPFLPASAGMVAFKQEIPGPFLLAGKPCRELTFTYTFQALDFTTSIALTDLDDEHSLAVIIYAPSADFAAIHAEGTQSMFRWMWLGSPTAHERGSGARVTGTSSSDYRPGK